MLVTVDCQPLTVCSATVVCVDTWRHYSDAANNLSVVSNAAAQVHMPLLLHKGIAACLQTGITATQLLAW